MAPSGPDIPDGWHCPPRRHCLRPPPQPALHAGVPAGKTTLQVTKTPAAPGKDHKRAKGMEKTKAVQEVPTSQKSPASRQPLATHFVPFVAHFGGRQPDSFKFLFYKPSCSNSYSPFYTAQRPTCGYRYLRDTDHTRKVNDVPSANIVKWRPIMDKKP